MGGRRKAQSRCTPVTCAVLRKKRSPESSITRLGHCSRKAGQFPRSHGLHSQVALKGLERPAYSALSAKLGNRLAKVSARLSSHNSLSEAGRRLALSHGTPWPARRHEAGETQTLPGRLVPGSPGGCGGVFPGPRRVPWVFIRNNWRIQLPFRHFGSCTFSTFPP